MSAPSPHWNTLAHTCLSESYTRVPLSHRPHVCSILAIAQPHQNMAWHASGRENPTRCLGAVWSMPTPSTKVRLLCLCIFGTCWENLAAQEPKKELLKTDSKCKGTLSNCK